jgi:hypothetical protein
MLAELEVGLTLDLLGVGARQSQRHDGRPLER